MCVPYGQEPAETLRELNVVGPGVMQNLCTAALVNVSMLHSIAALVPRRTSQINTAAVQQKLQKHNLHSTELLLQSVREWWRNRVHYRAVHAFHSALGCLFMKLCTSAFLACIVSAVMADAVSSFGR